MATAVLVEYALQGGSRLLKEADRQGVEITAAFWMYNEEVDAWRLVLSAPSVGKVGPLYLIRAVRELLKNMTDDEREGLSMGDTIVLEPHWHEIEDMRRRFGRVESEPSEDRWYRSRRDEPYIYRLI